MISTSFSRIGSILLSGFLVLSFCLHTQSLSASVWLECPPNVTLSCEEDLSNLDKWGQAWVWENYKKVLALQPKTVIKNTNACGVGTITRTYEYEDKHWNIHHCTQVITVTNGAAAFGYDDIYWPPSLEVEGCNPNVDPRNLKSPYDYPTFNRKKCSQPMYSFSDTKFTVADGCIKVLRDWKVIDWCQYVPNKNPQVGLWTYTQVIKIVVKDTTAYIQCIKDTVIDVNDQCNGLFVKLDSVKAFSKCGAIKSILNNSPYSSQKGPDASGIYPIGTTEFYYFAEVGCGKQIKCKMTVTVRNKIQPTPYCLTGLIIALMPVDTNRDGTPDDGMIEVWAKDFNQGSYHKCGYKNLKFSFSADTNDKSRVFTCAELGKNTVEMWVTDQNGNQSFCRTMIEIQNNNARIPDCKRKDSLTNTGSNLSISGAVFFENHNPVADVTLCLYDRKGYQINETKTPIIKTTYDTIRTQSGTVFYIQRNDTTYLIHRDTVWNSLLKELTNDSIGAYLFSSLKKDLEPTLMITKKKLDLAGVDFNDVLKLLRITQYLDKIQSPYQYIACDVNNDKLVNFADVDLLYQVVAGKLPVSKIPQLWRFLSMKSGSLEYNTPQEIPALQQKVDLNDYMAIKAGDINGSFTNFEEEILLDSRSKTILWAKDQVVKKAQLVELELSTQNSILAYMLKSGDNGVWKLLEVNDQPYSGEAWIDQKSTATNKLKLKILMSKDGLLSDLIHLSADSWIADVELKIPSIQWISAEQNLAMSFNPNPVSAGKDLQISISTDTEGGCDLKIIDLSGKSIYSKSYFLHSGVNQYPITVDENWTDGLYFIELKRGEQLIHQKLLITK